MAESIDSLANRIGGLALRHFPHFTCSRGMSNWSVEIMQMRLTLNAFLIRANLWKGFSIERQM